MERYSAPVETTKLVRMWAALNPSGEWWQLPLRALEGTTRVIVGWTLDAAPIDGGVPSSAASILIRVLTVHFRVTFPDGDLPTAHGVRFALRSAIDPQEASIVFDASGFPWSMQGQAAFLSPLTAQPPSLSQDVVRAVLRGSIDVHLLSSQGVTGLLLPAVDGDYALVSLFGEQWPALESSLQDECKQNGVVWQLLSEEQAKNAGLVAG